MPPRPPPHDFETEKLCLGSMLTEPTLLFECDDMHAEWFWQQSHRLIYLAIRDVVQKEEVQKNTIMAYVDAELCSRGWMSGMGPSMEASRTFLRDIQKSVVSTASFGIHAARLRDLYLRRILLDRMRDWHGQIHDAPDAGDLLRDVMEWASKATSSTRGEEDESFKTVTPLLLDEIEQRRQGEASPAVFPTGVEPFDDLLEGGPALGHYTVLAAKKKMGKTRMSIAIMNSLLTQKETPWAVDFYSGEMTKRDIAKLFVSAHTGWDFKHLADPQVDIREDWARLAVNAMVHLNELDIRVHVGKTHVRDILYRTKARRARLGQRPLAVVVDYLQIMRGYGENEYAQVTNVTETLALIAKTIPNTWVLSLAQFNRSAGADLPKPHQLRSSGQIEQDVDQLFILHRPAQERDDATPRDHRMGILWKALDRFHDPGKMLIDADLARVRFTRDL